MLKRVCAVYFSGTGTTEKVVKAIAKKAAKELDTGYGEWDFTPLFAREKDLVFEEDELVIFGVPVIAGRVPNLLLKYLKRIKSFGALAVPVVLYGNRNFDDALMELKDILKESGARIIGAAAFVGEHSFSEILGKGRPDEEDMKVAEKLAEKIVEKIKNDDLSEPTDIPGTLKPYRGYYQPQNRYGEPIDIRKVKPKTDMSKCDNCGLCAELCPLGSIEKDDVSKISGICMKCCACIKKCPKGAKYFDDPGYIYHKEELEEQYKRRGKILIRY